MINLPLTDEQVVTLIEQLPHEKKKEILEHLQFEAWLDSPEALALKEKSEKDVREGRVMTMEQLKERLRKSGKIT